MSRLRSVGSPVATVFSGWLVLKPVSSTANATCQGFVRESGKELEFDCKKNPRGFLKKSSRLGTTSDLFVVHTLILSLSILYSTAQRAISKIILHRIISAVWLTNFLSEIQSLSNHDDETQFRILSVKPIWSFSALDHWWSLTVQLWAVMDGEQSEWPIFIYIWVEDV